MAIVRQELNLLDHNIAAAAADTTSNEIVQLDTAQYNGTVTYYFEVLCSKTSGDSVTISLRRSGTSTDDATIASASIGTTLGLVRSASFTPPAGATEYRVFVDYTSGTGARVKSARIIVIQNATTLTNTETQIEIGNYNTNRTAETAAILTNPKYWQYTASKWDGTTAFYAEAVYATALSNMDAMDVYLYESTAIDAPSWSAKATIFTGTPGVTTPLRSRVAFTPVDGRWYTIFSLNGSMDNHDIYRAGVVVGQREGAYISIANQDAIIQGGTAGAGQTSQAEAQKFELSASATITGVILKLKKTASPTDTISVDLVSSLGGSSLANATLASSSLTTSYVAYTLTFGTPYSASASTAYYIQVTRSPDSRDTTNYISWEGGTELNAATNYRSIDRNNNTWGVENTSPQRSFQLTGQAGLTKLEPQYLLANTLFAAGTALQTFLTKWDSTEWDQGSGTLTYTFQAETANGSTSDVTLNTAAGTLVTGSTLTNIDNAQISGALTMPADGNLDTIATGNAGDVAAARILVAYVFLTIQKIYKVVQTIKRASYF
jgi:hypothetical protein